MTYRTARLSNQLSLMPQVRDSATPDGVRGGWQPLISMSRSPDIHIRCRPRLCTRLFLSRFPKQLKRCLSISAAVLMLFLWLCLTAALRLPPSPLVTKTSSSQDALVVSIRQAEQQQVTLFSISRRSREEHASNNKARENATLIRDEVTQKRMHFLGTDVQQDKVKPLQRVAITDKIINNFGRSASESPDNLRDIIKTSNVIIGSRRRIQELKIRNLKFPRNSEFDKSTNTLFETRGASSSSGHTVIKNSHQSPTFSPSPANLFPRNQVPSPPSPVKAQIEGERCNKAIDSGDPITSDTRIRSHRQATGEKLSDLQPNYGAFGTGTDKNSRLPGAGECDNGPLKSRRTNKVEDMTMGDANLGKDGFLEAEHSLQSDEYRQPSGKIYSSVPEVKLERGSSKTRLLGHELRKKLAGRDVRWPQKSINVHLPSTSREHQLNFYDVDGGRGEINTQTLPAHFLVRNEFGIEMTSIHSVTRKSLQSKNVENPSNQYPTTSIAGSARSFISEMKTGERVAMKPPQDSRQPIEKVSKSIYNLPAMIGQDKQREMRESGGNRHGVTPGAKLVVKYRGLSRTNPSIIDGDNEHEISTSGYTASQPTTREHAQLVGSRRVSSLDESDLTFNSGSQYPLKAHSSPGIETEMDWQRPAIKSTMVDGDTPRIEKPLYLSPLQEQKNTESYIDHTAQYVHGTGSDAAVVEDGILYRPQKLNLSNDGFDVYAYNATASNALPLDRAIPDTRPSGCTSLPAYSAEARLPSATIIICFHNEALSVLLRTVHSVFSKTPAYLLDKVILVNDASTFEDLSPSSLSKLSSLNKVDLVTTKQREGLVRARLIGASLAKSDVLIFLDAHCECNVGWIEPLLHSLSHDRHKVVSPYIDTIKAESLEYRQSPTNLQGSFNWRLEFGWRAAPNPGKATDPIRTPVISGGLFAVTRDYFKQIGGYDPQLNIWGGENFELSFKTWMCGGSLVILPCSRVGHVFRASLPYSFTPLPGDERVSIRETTVLRNLARVASVWMDQYADIFYAAVDLPNDIDIGDINERLRLRESLQCNSFGWYLQHVFPQLKPVSNTTRHYGQVRNSGSLMCLDVMSERSRGFFLGLTACHGGVNQTVRLTANNQLRIGEVCIVPGHNDTLALAGCSAQVSWSYQEPGFLLHDHSKRCLTSVDNELVQLLPCDPSLSETKSQPDRESDREGYSINQRGTGENNRGQASKKYSAIFQQWTFDYSFNWKRKRRKA